MNIINESGLYTLIMRSNKPAAKKFRKWVTGTVLPALRKNGSYSIGKEKQLNYVSRGIMSSARKIFEKALESKNEKDFQVTMALDKVFQQFTGRSALEMAGIKLVKKTEFISHKVTQEGEFYGCYFNEYKEHLEWKHDLLKIQSSEDENSLLVQAAENEKFLYGTDFPEEEN